MQTPVLSSTFFLTVLMLIGLMFFIRASTKDRIELAHLTTHQQREQVLERLQRYFAERAYRLINTDAERDIVTFEGFVRPSVFLAIFLSFLAATGLLCLSLILTFLFPSASPALLGVVILAPAAGIFYWKRSARPEQVSLRVDAIENASDAEADGDNVGDNIADSEKTALPQSLQTIILVKGHRDELAELQRSLNLKRADVEQT
ncbi:MAG: cofactor assembly of complex C subunit B [Elainellaceae cyanobacterium]